MSDIATGHEIGSPPWLVAAEHHFGGFVTGVPRNRVSPHDPRSREELARGGMTGGDRMAHHGYAEAYSRFLAPFVARRHERLTIVEIGILKGTGLALLSRLFPRATLIGLDVDPQHFRDNLAFLKSRGAFGEADPEVHEFDQFSDGEDKVLQILRGRKVDIVIDDGFNSIDTIVNSARALKSSLAADFVYFTEDNAAAATALRREFPDHPVLSAGELTVVRSTTAAPGHPEVPAAAAAQEAPVSQQEVLELLGLLRPLHMASDHKVRVGGDGDGGYVMPSLARRSNLVLSIGIGSATQVGFDSELADLGAQVLQFDHTIPGQPVAHENFRFFSLGWGARDDGPLRTLKSMMALADWGAARHPILKFDVEGAEWDALAVTDSSDIARFDLLAGEFHGFHALASRPVYTHLRGVIEKLCRTHVPVHLHANNATGIRVVLGVPVPPLLEITFVRRGVVVTAGHSTEPIPGPLDRPNRAGQPDLCLRPF